MESRAIKWLLVIGVLTLVLAAVNLVLLLRLPDDLRGTFTSTDPPAEAHWTDENGLQHSRAAIRKPGESVEEWNARLQADLRIALRLFPAKDGDR